MGHGMAQFTPYAEGEAQGQYDYPFGGKHKADKKKQNYIWLIEQEWAQDYFLN